jgi:hypothetical protein
LTRVSLTASELAVTIEGMTTERQRANLRQGGIQGTAETARRARQAKASYAAETNRIGGLAASDPHAALAEMHSIMTRHTLKLLRAEERSSGKPARDVTDRLREYRQLTEALAEYQGSRGGVTEARQFFETLDERMETLRRLLPCPNCGSTDLAVKPVIDAPE